MHKINNAHILKVDDEKLNIELAAAYLMEVGYKLSFALGAEAAIKSVMSKDIDLILLDINMPKTDGFKVCKMLKDDKKSKDIPIIFLTAQTSIEYISQAFEVGGVDYISKPFNGIELKARVKTHLQNLFYLQEIKEKQSKLAQLSITDPLTKLYNSFFFDSQLKTRIDKGRKFWVLYIKINNFSKINTLFGFEKANKILKLFAQLLQDVAYANSVVARLYGSSFGILIKDYDRSNIRELGNSFSKKFLKHKDLSKNINFSIVALKPKDNTTTLLINKEMQAKMQSALDDDENINILFIN